MTREEIEEKYNVRCEIMKNPYAEDAEFWTVKDAATNDEIGRCATHSDIVKLLSVVQGDEFR